jgi:transcriptional regulator with XRE-family HTH domain
LGRRIRSLRRSRDLSQEGLAEKAGISYKHLGEIERGKANVTIDIVERIAAALDMEMVELFDYEHEGEVKELSRKINGLIKGASEGELRKVLRVLRAITR